MTELPLQLPADLKKVETMSHGKLKMIFISQEEVKPEVRSKIMALHEKFGWLSFMAGENNIQAEHVANLPKLVKYEEEMKSPSQRLRGVLFRLWEQNGNPMESSDAYYRSIMENLINHYKEMLT